MKRIIITIDKKGNARIDVDGIAGSECLAAALPFERALGVDDDAERVATSDMWAIDAARDRAES